MTFKTNFRLYVGVVLLVDSLLMIGGSLLTGQVLGAYFQTNLPLLIFFSTLVIVLGRFTIKYWYAQKQFQEMARALEVEQKKLKLLEYSIDECSELVFWINRQGQLCNVNLRLLEVLGFHRESLIGQSPLRIDPSLEPPVLAQYWAETVTDARVLYKTELRTAEGQSISYEVALNRFAWSNEDYLCGFARDFTDRKKAEAELQASKELLEVFMAGLPGGAFVRVIGQGLIYSNSQLAEFSPRQESSIEIEDRLTWEKGAQVFEFNHFDEAGRRVFLDLWKFPIHLPGRPPMVGGVVFDTTARKQNELDLLENQAFLEATIAQSPVGIVIIDPRSQLIRFCNSVAIELLGLERLDSLVGQRLDFDRLSGQVLAPDGSKFPPDRNPLQLAFFDKEPSRERLILRRPEGGDRFVLLNSSPIYAKTGETLAVLMAFLDITELKVVQDQLEELNRRLEQMVDDRTWELMQANETLKSTIADLKRTQNQLIESEKFASLGSLVAGVAHEINTPVGVGVTAASFLTDKVTQINQLYASQQMRKSDLENFLANATQSAQIIQANLDRASNLIKSFKMISVDRSTDQKRPFRLRDYCLEVFRSLHPPEARLQLEVRVEGDPEVELFSYPGTISQILTNLYMNSCTHGFEGLNQGQVEVTFQRTTGGVTLTYRDNGRGMDEATLKRIYEPFFTTRRDLGGTGLGMNIVFNLVNQKLAGSIVASSQPGHGVEFTIHIPQ